MSIVQQQYSPARNKKHDGKWLDSLLQNSMFAGAAHPGRSACFTRIAYRPDEMQAAEALVQRRYAWRGYQFPTAQNAYVAGSSSSRVVILAEKGCGELVGTLTVRPDSSRGLLAEMTYAAEIQELRGEGHRLGEVVRLAVEENGNSRIALDALVRAAYVISHLVQGRSHVVIEVNPRHVRFYEKMLGFVQASAERLCSRVGAPSVLMKLDLEQFGRRLHAAAGKLRPQLEVVA